jgi:mono/diheme cytochrome c family protein
MKKIIGIGILALNAACLIGCQPPQSTPPLAQFEPNMVYAKAWEIDEGYSMAEALAETETAVSQFFGTPDAPALPSCLTEDDDYAGLVSMENLHKASGGPTQEGRGLYRKHCAICHGITGNGRGETAYLLDPYPRDYRMGKFKFKSTTRGGKPLREDLVYSIKNGIAGTSMQAIPDLTEADIEALVDYVIYLSLRGEFERAMIMAGADLDFEVDEDGNSEHLFFAGSPKDEFEEQVSDAEDLLTEIADSWLEAEDRVKAIPAPEGIPVPGTIAEVLAAANAPGESPLKESIAKGKELFASELSACSKCHGKEGYGEAAPVDYDDWTKDWTARINVDPTNFDMQVPLLARGALPPRKILPRDFREGLYRGGSEPERLYRRIAFGIDGTPMPAATIPANDIWHLVNYVRSLAVPAPQEPADATVAQSNH